MISFTKEYFEDKFSKIPDEEWITKTYVNESGKSALGHCGEFNSNNPTIESLALEKIFEEKKLRVSIVNDGESPQFIQNSPKQRILAALKLIN